MEVTLGKAKTGSMADCKPPDEAAIAAAPGGWIAPGVADVI